MKQQHLILFGIASVSIFLAALLVIALLLNRAYDAREDSFTFYESCQKVWAHRGYWEDGSTENSIAAFRDAVARGAKGLELDIFYDDDNRRFIVSHDSPFPLGDQTVLTLADVYSIFGNDIFYWLDFKNLVTMQDEVTERAITSLHTLMKSHAVTAVSIVESHDPSRLAMASHLGINTSFWIAFNDELNWFRYNYHLLRLKVHYLLGHFVAVSMNYMNLSPVLLADLGHVPLLLFTINERTVLDTYLNEERVKIILSDKDYFSATSVNCASGLGEFEREVSL